MARVYTDAQKAIHKECSKRWNDANLDRMNIAFSKADGERVRKTAALAGMSVNAFMKQAALDACDRYEQEQKRVYILPVEQ